MRWLDPLADWRLFRIAVELVWLTVTTRGFQSPKRAQRVLGSLTRLGVVFVKFGQWMSVRPDMVPPDVAAELEALQDEMRPMPPARVRGCIEAELGLPLDHVFQEFADEPVAAASIAQVHRATLKDSGESVAVKVQRPRLERAFARDLRALRLFISVLRPVVGHDRVQDAFDLLEVFERTLHEEVDFEREARNQTRARALFEQDPHIKVPRVFDELTTRRLLVMEFLEGLRLREVVAKENIGLDPRVLADAMAVSFFNQFFRHGFYHADPHPGNFLFLPGNTAAFMDFGIVGTFDSITVGHVRDWIRALAEQDLPRLTKTLMRLGRPRAPIDDVALRMDLYRYLILFDGTATDGVPYRDAIEVFTDLLARHRIRVPAPVLFFNKTLATLEGVARQLDPDFDWAAAWRPRFEEEEARRFSPEELFRERYHLFGDYRDLALDLPELVRSALEPHEQRVARAEPPGRSRTQVVGSMLILAVGALAFASPATIASLDSATTRALGALLVAGAFWREVAGRTRD